MPFLGGSWEGEGLVLKGAAFAAVQGEGVGRFSSCLAVMEGRQR